MGQRASVACDRLMAMSTEKDSIFDETLEILADTELLQSLIEAEAELSSGGGHTLDEVLERLRKDEHPYTP